MVTERNNISATTYGALLVATGRALGSLAEAEQLLSAASGFPDKLQLAQSLSNLAPAAVADRLQTMQARRLAGEPLQYITGLAPFYGRDLRVASGCLIPRPETEVLVEAAIRWLTAHNPSATVFDLGCGSGAISISVALACPHAHVVAADVSAAALAIAVANAARLSAPVRFHAGDGFAWLEAQASASPVQVVLSNPPYISATDYAALPCEIRDWEPEIALRGGDDGLAMYRRLVDLPQRVFAPGACALLLEVGAGQAQDVIRLFTSDAKWSQWSFTTLLDLRAVERVVVAQRGG